MARQSRKPVRIIDHDPLEKDRTHAGSSVFGKRRANDDHVQHAPQDPNGISEYFINRVREHQKTKSANYDDMVGQRQIHRSAIRDTIDDDYIETSRIPVASIAAVIALTFIIPFSFIFVTESMNDFSPGIDPVTTSSVARNSELKVRNISMTKLLKNGTFVVTINGRIENRSDRAKSLMPLTVVLRDKEGRQVQSWRHRIGKSALTPNTTVRFMTSAIDFSGKADTAHVLAQTVK